MPKWRRGRARWLLAVAAAPGWFAAAGCGDDRGIPVAHNRITTPPAEPARAMGPLTAAPDANPAPETAMAPADNVSLDARLLVITADGADSGLDAIMQALRYLGTPYDVLNASTGPALTADYLAAGDHGRYYGIVLDRGDLAVGSSSAFSEAEWTALTSYEARFGVRRAVLYAIPTAAYGLRMTGGFDVRSAPFSASCTIAGHNVFVGANCWAPVAVADGWAYSSEPIDSYTLPLLVDAAGNTYAATRTYADGREAMVLTFAQSPTALHTLGLIYGVVSWVTRGLFVGERHVYASAQIDDFFLASAIYPATGTTYRISGADLKAFTNWQSARRADPLTAEFRSTFAFNAFGARPQSQDALTDEAREVAPNFAWISHTWDHKDMTAMAYAEAFEEFSKNHQYGLGLVLSHYSVENLVTPGVTGLNNAEVMHAAYDLGIRQLVSDTSVAGQANPSPNAGYNNALVPALLVIPRRPTELYFNVSQPAEWVAEYDALHSSADGYDQIVATASDMLVRYLLRGENDPWMFHQANLRDLGGGQSLLSHLLDVTLDKYTARATFPVLSPTMDELAQRVKARIAFDASGVSATLEPGSKLTVHVTNAATVPVTGVCTPWLESYAGQQISYLQLAAGQSITLSLADCNGGTGSTGTGGGPGTGAQTGNSAGGGSTGEGGAGGNGTKGKLSTDGSLDPTSPDASGCACVFGDGAPPGAAWGGAVLALLACAIAGGRRRRATIGHLAIP